MNTLKYILKKYNLRYDDKTPMPIEIPNVGREQLTILFKELGFKKGVEIGVLAGEYSELICRNNPGVKLYGIDSYKAYCQHKSQRHLDRFYKKAKVLLAPYKKYQFIIESSKEAVNRFKNNSLDFVYIDGNHDFSSVMIDIILWSEKIRSGGIISGHDYLNRREPTNHRVKQALIPYVKYNKIIPWFVLGLRVKKPGLIRDKERSWMWVK